MSDGGVGLGVWEVMGWGGGGMRQVRRVGMGGSGEEFVIYFKCRGKLWEILKQRKMGF